MSGVVSKFDIPTSFVVQLETYEKKRFGGGTSAVRMMVEITFAGGVMSVIQISRSGGRTTVVTVSVSTHQPKFVRNGEALCMQFWNRKTHSVLANSASSEPLTIYILGINRSTILDAWLAESKKVIAQSMAGIQQFRDIREKLAQHDKVQLRHEAEIEKLHTGQKELKDAVKEELNEIRRSLWEVEDAQECAAVDVGEMLQTLSHAGEAREKKLDRLGDRVERGALAIEAKEARSSAKIAVSKVCATSDAHGLVLTASLSGERERQATRAEQRRAKRREQLDELKKKRKEMEKKAEKANKAVDELQMEQKTAAKTPSRRERPRGSKEI